MLLPNARVAAAVADDPPPDRVLLHEQPEPVTHRRLRQGIARQPGQRPAASCATWGQLHPPAGSRAPAGAHHGCPPHRRGTAPAKPPTHRARSATQLNTPPIGANAPQPSGAELVPAHRPAAIPAGQVPRHRIPPPEPAPGHPERAQEPVPHELGVRRWPETAVMTSAEDRVAEVGVLEPGSGAQAKLRPPSQERGELSHAPALAAGPPRDRRSGTRAVMVSRCRIETRGESGLGSARPRMLWHELLGKVVEGQAAVVPQRQSTARRREALWSSRRSGRPSRRRARARPATAPRTRLACTRRPSSDDPVRHAWLPATLRGSFRPGHPRPRTGQACSPPNRLAVKQRRKPALATSTPHNGRNAVPGPNARAGIRRTGGIEATWRRGRISTRRRTGHLPRRPPRSPGPRPRRRPPRPGPPGREPARRAGRRGRTAPVARQKIGVAVIPGVDAGRTAAGDAVVRDRCHPVGLLLGQFRVGDQRRRSSVFACGELHRARAPPMPPAPAARPTRGARRPRSRRRCWRPRPPTTVAAPASALRDPTPPGAACLPPALAAVAPVSAPTASAAGWPVAAQRAA